MGERNESAQTGLYHERQHLQMCLLHALNNLLQGKEAFSKSELDRIADSLVTLETSSQNWSPLSLVYKPHRNAITGNYDANVLIAALKSRGKEVVWYDRRKGCAGLDLAASQEGMLGIMINLQRNRLAGLWKGRHWVALGNINGSWYNLDSDLPAPVCFSQGLQELEGFLGNMLEKGAEIFILRKDGVDAAGDVAQNILGFVDSTG